MNKKILKIIPFITGLLILNGCSFFNSQVPQKKEMKFYEKYNKKYSIDDKEIAIFFPNDSAKPYKKSLDYVKKQIKKISKSYVSIYAFTDACGNEKHNENLSKKRAEFAKKYFQKKNSFDIINLNFYGEKFSIKCPSIKDRKDLLIFTTKH
jgi:outer membrane protein OmpA-like peptidoglycan-associated protein